MEDLLHYIASSSMAVVLWLLLLCWNTVKLLNKDLLYEYLFSTEIYGVIISSVWVNVWPGSTCQWFRLYINMQVNGD